MTEFFKRYLSNKCTEEDFNSALDLFTNLAKERELTEQMREYWTTFNNPENELNLKEVLYKVHYEINNREVFRRKNQLLTNFKRIAAVLVIPLVLFSVFWYFSRIDRPVFMQTITAPMASRSQFELPDGSKVWLNAGSTMSFQVPFAKDSRQIKLRGQAYFDVKKSEIPFIVETEQFKVNVLGTAFDVSAYSGERALVTLVRGKVKIGQPVGNETTLLPGEQAKIELGQNCINKRTVDVEQFVSWKDDILIFANEPLEDAILKLERWYNLDITIANDSIKNIHVTGKFKYESIDEILRLMEITDSIEHIYDKNKRKLILK